MCITSFFVSVLRFDVVSSVTFSRIDPEGKLVMGFRKASTAPTSDQVCLSKESSAFCFFRQENQHGLLEPSTW